MIKTQEIINDLQKIKVSEEDRKIILLACERLAYLGNRLNNINK